MSEELRDQIYNNLNLRETDELLEIWQQHDSAEWTEVALDVVREILQGRLGELPAAAEEVDESGPDGEDESPETLAAPPDEDVAEPGGEALVCPNCKGNHTHMREVEIRNRPGANLVLIKRGIPLERLLGMEEYDEIVGVACEDCGFVFFMLKDFV